MLDHTKQNARYYLFSLSNFLAAVGGGMILGKGVATIKIPILQGGSLLAFFVGTVFGLALLQSTPKKFAHVFSRWFSICGSFTSLLLLSVFITYKINETLSGNPAIVFFILLSMRFGFWFFSRVLRAANAAGQEQSIAWVEFGYYIGVITGLILWLLLGIDIGMAFTLLLDACLQFVAGSLDLYANRIKNPEQTVNEKEPLTIGNLPVSNKFYDKIWSWRLAIAVMLLTVGVQVIFFNLAHQVSSYFSPYMLAIFYFGAAVSSIFCKQFNVRLEWHLPTTKHKGYATILLNKAGNTKRISFVLLNFLSAIGVAAVALTVYWKINTIDIYPLFGIKEFLLLFLVFISTFFYEIITLSILDRIGLEEKNSPHKGMVLRTYGIMSIAAAISLWLLEMVNGAIFYLLLTLIFCFILTFLSVWRRSFNIA